jgi:hypothetical protein
MMNWYNKFLRFAAFRNKVLMLAKSIATKLYTEIVNRFENNKLRHHQQIVINKNKEATLEDYGIRQIIIEIGELNSGKNAISIKGDFFPEWFDIKISVNINFNYFNKTNYEFLSTELRNIIGHEIEHASNVKENPSIPYSWDETKPSSLMNCVYEFRKYFLNESEINAHIRENMWRAKYNGTILENLLEELIKNKIFTCNPTEINNHIAQKTEDGIEISQIIQEINAVYRNKISQIYSNRKSYNAK